MTQTHSFSLNSIMAAILNSAILNSAILNYAILGFPLKLTHTCQDWFPPFAQKKTSSHLPPHHLHKKKLYSFLLTQLDDGSHLEFCHFGFRTLPSWIQSPWCLLSDSLENTLAPLLFWLKLIQSDSNSFIFTQLNDGSHLEFWPSWIQTP